MNMPGFFVADPDYRLPHPRIPLRIVLVAHAALTRAFQLLRAKPPTGFIFANAKEDEITLELLPGPGGQTPRYQHGSRVRPPPIQERSSGSRGSEL